MALEIIGPGFGRTGTNSLKLALEQLGFGPSHHMFEVRDNPEQLSGWQAVARGESVDWDQVFRGYRSQVDWPGARVWRELAQHWPDAKVILTVRDPDEWFDSVQATIAGFLAARGQHSNDHVNGIAAMAQALIAEQVFDDRLSDRAHATPGLSRPRGGGAGGDRARSGCWSSMRAKAGNPCAPFSARRTSDTLSEDQFVEGVQGRGVEAGLSLGPQLSSDHFGRVIANTSLTPRILVVAQPGDRIEA